MTPIRLINLERATDRLQAFVTANQDVDAAVEVFRAVDGSIQDIDDLIREDYVAPGLMERYTASNLGCSLSHICLWQEAVDRAEPTTACEDDAVLRRDFAARSAELISSAPDFGIILWGWNFDAPLAIELMPGTHAALRCDQAELRETLAVFPTIDIKPRLFRLRQAFGTVCYTVSPAGARKLLDRLVPLRPLEITLAGKSQRFPHVGIDVALSSVYAELSAYVCVPPLVVTPNIKSGETA
jgi:GR25 family glycosyltransferase involved in LPS biosynthesis